MFVNSSGDVLQPADVYTQPGTFREGCSWQSAHNAYHCLGVHAQQRQLIVEDW